MFDNIEKGSVLKLYENADDKFIVIDTVKKDNENYLILNPFELNEKSEVAINIEKMFMIRLAPGMEGFEYVKDAGLIKELIQGIL